MKPDVTVKGRNHLSTWFDTWSLEYDNNDNITFIFHIQTKWDIDFKPRRMTYYLHCYNLVINYILCNIYMLDFYEEILNYDIFIQSEVC